MARNQGSSMQNGSKLGHSKYQENGLEKSIRKMGNEVSKLRSRASSNIAYCKIPHKKWWTKDTICNLWSLRPHILSNR
jgi:hypothetical protein